MNNAINLRPYLEHYNRKEQNSRIDRIWNHKTSLKYSKSIQIISMFSNHSEMKLEIINRRKQKIHNYMEIKEDF